MGNIVRLSSGGQIQVRTGVLSGVGPAGPRGLIGPAGPDGGQGPEGPQGPMGQILQVQSKTVIAGTTTLVANTNGLVSFGTVAYDDMGCIASSTNFTFRETGDYLFHVWAKFSSDGSNAGHRRLFLQSNINGMLSVAGVDAVATVESYVSMSVPFRTTTINETIQVYANSAEAGSISEGGATIARIGSGPVGPVGPQGPQGVPGPVGPQGPTGPQGNASSGFVSYGDLL